MNRFVSKLGKTNAIVDWFAGREITVTYFQVASWSSPGRAAPGWARPWLAKMAVEKGIAPEDMPIEIRGYLKLFSD